MPNLRVFSTGHESNQAREIERLRKLLLTPEEAEYALRYLPTEPVEHPTCQAKLRAIAKMAE